MVFVIIISGESISRVIPLYLLAKLLECSECSQHVFTKESKCERTVQEGTENQRRGKQNNNMQYYFQLLRPKMINQLTMIQI